MSFLNLLYFRQVISPVVAGIACFVLGTHHSPANGTSSPEQDLAMINGCVVSACNYTAVV